MKTEETRHKEIRKYIYSTDSILKFDLIEQIDKYTQSEVHTSNAKIYVRCVPLMIMIAFAGLFCVLCNRGNRDTGSDYKALYLSEHAKVKKAGKIINDLNYVLYINKVGNACVFDMDDLDNPRNYDIAHRNCKK